MIAALLSAIGIATGVIVHLSSRIAVRKLLQRIPGLRLLIRYGAIALIVVVLWLWVGSSVSLLP